MDALETIVTVGPSEVAQPARIEDVWLSLTYPLTVRELQRLSQFQTFLNARVFLHDQGLNCSKLAAKRLAFARYLVTNRRIGEGRR